MDNVEVFPPTSILWVCKIRRKFSGEKLKVVGVGLHFDAIQNCGITSVGAQFYNDGVATNGFGVSPAPSQLDRKQTWGVTSVPNGFLQTKLK